MPNWNEDPYFKKRIDYVLEKRRFRFDTAELLFSTFQVDLGTQFLLRNIRGQFSDSRSILDLGCGYGVIGIVLAKLHPAAKVLLVDKDLLALRYAEHNAHLNGVSNVDIVGSIGITDIPPQSFDLVVSNVPAHIGDAAIAEDFILGPVSRLHDRSTYCFVVVSRLEELVTRVCAEHDLAMTRVAKRPGHALFQIQKV